MKYLTSKQKNRPATKRLALALSPLCALIYCQAGFASEQDAVETTGTYVVTADALKTNQLTQETPKSVSLVAEKQLKTLAPQKVDEALRYTAGVTAQPYGADNDTDWFKVRGFDASTYLDGSRLNREGYYTWLLEPYGLQQLEVVKGPSAILFGESPPGGVVNLVQKKPTDTPQGAIHFELGSNNHRSLGIDISDEANDSGSVRYRVVGLVKSADGELNETEADRIYFAPSVAIDVSDQTTLTVLASYLEDDGIPTNPFFPAAGTILDTPNGKIDPSTNYGEPDYDQYERQQVSVGYLLDHDLSDEWTFSQKLNLAKNDLLLRSVYAFFNSDTSATDLSRGVVFREGTNQTFSIDNRVTGNWSSSTIDHNVLAGLELQHNKTDGLEQDNYGFSTINAFSPVYGNYTPLDSANNTDREITKQQVGLYSQYQLTFNDQWIGLMGARYDWIETENKNKTASTTESRDDGELSLNAGIMYLADNGLSPYFSYGQSFNVLSTVDSSTNELYKPLEGEQFELGVKYTPEDFDGYINVAWFDITQKNALVTNPSTFVATQVGEATSEGIEVEFVGEVYDALTVSANYTYTKSMTDDSSNQGTQQAGLIPRHAASVWVGYEGVEDWSFGSGVRYIGESKDNPKSSDATIPSVTLWDASISYDITPQWQAQLNINNIFDEEYVSACDYWCYYGPSRSVMLSANYNF